MTERNIIYSKTAKGITEVSRASSGLPRALRAILKEIDGKTPASELRSRFGKHSDADWRKFLQVLENDGYIRDASPQPMPTLVPVRDEGMDLDFTSIASEPKNEPSAAEKRAAARRDEQNKVELLARIRARQESEEKARQASADKARKEADEKVKQALLAKAKQEADERAKREAEAKARRQAEAKAKLDAEEKARQAAAEKARKEVAARERREAEERARQEAMEKARRDAEERARQEAAAKARQEAEEQARREAELKRQREEQEKARLAAIEKARREAEEKARREAEAQAKREAEERARRLEEEKRHRDAQEKARLEAEAQTRREAEERARQEAEAKARREAAEAARREAEERERRAAEERARKEAEEAARREIEERQRREAEAAARLEAEEKSRREAEERALREAEQRARKEAEERQREEAARREADEKTRREAEEKARIEAEARRHREAEEAAKREAEERARIEAEEAAHREAEEKARREAEERERREAEELARQAAEEAARHEADQQARAEADARAKAEAEAQERRELDERERREAEERARAAEEEARRQAEQQRLAVWERAKFKAEVRLEQEAAEKAEREAEERARQAEMERIRSEENALAAAKQAALQMDDNELAQRKARIDAATKAEELAARRAQQIRKFSDIKWGKLVLLVLVPLLVIALVRLHIVSFDERIPQVQAIASDRLGQPVTVDALYFSLFPRPRWHAQGVRIGGAEQVTVHDVEAVIDLRKTLSEGWSFSSLTLKAPFIKQEALEWLLYSRAGGRAIPVTSVKLREATLLAPGIDVPRFDADAGIGPDGNWRQIDLNFGDRDALVTMQPTGERIQYELTSISFLPPFGGDFAFDDFTARGNFDRNGLIVDEFEGRNFGGTLTGNAKVDWTDAWSIEGAVKARQPDARKLAPALLGGGRVDGLARFSMRAKDARTLFAAPRLEGDFSISQGEVLGIDLMHVLQNGADTKKTAFRQITGKFVRDGDAIQLKQIKLDAGMLSAAGTLEVAGNGVMRGRFSSALTFDGRQTSGAFSLSGTRDAPKFSR